MSSSSPPPPPPPDMHALLRPSHSAHRAHPFSIRDFEQLISDAFDPPSTPALRLTPASPTPSKPTSAATPSAQAMVRSYFDDTDDTDDDSPRAYEVRPRRSAQRPRSQSFSAFDPQRILPPSSFTSYAEPTSRRGVAKRVFNTLRTRASALVLRPSNSPSSPVNAGRDTPASLFTLPSRTSISTATARPSSQSSGPSRSPVLTDFPSRGDGSSTLADVDVTVALAQHKSNRPPLAPLRILPLHAIRDGPRTADNQSSRSLHSQSPAPTLLGDLVSAQRSTTPRFFARPRTPSLSSSSSPSNSRYVHTRLPPLKQSRSFHMLSKRQRKHLRKSSLLEPFALAVASSSMSIEFEPRELSSRCPSPYKNPRDPPPVPSTAPITHSDDPWQYEDLGQELEVPSYVFGRRGSASSVTSAASVKSTQTLAERISKAIPRTLKMTQARSRSKLNLSVITNSSNESTPNSSDTSTMFSASAYSGSLPPTPYSSSFYGMSSSRRTSVESETMLTDRVLALEEDPFKKGEIEVPLERGRTPMPYEEPPSPIISGEAWMERMSKHGTLRKRSTGSGHAHTNSGDTITPLTSGLDERPQSPVDFSNQPFVFPARPDDSASSSRLTPSPTPTPYQDWSPISLRSNLPLPNIGSFPAHIATIPSSPTSSISSFGSPLPSSPGPPPNIPPPPSPSPPRVLRKRRSRSSLRVAALVSNKEIVRRFSDRPPSPFPMADSTMSSVLSPTDLSGAEEPSSSGFGNPFSSSEDRQLDTQDESRIEGPQVVIDIRAESKDLAGLAPAQAVGWQQHEFFTPGSAFSETFDHPALSPSPKAIRASRSDSALPRPQAHISSTASDYGHGHARQDSAGTIREIEDRWEGGTSYSTAFYSARSSMLSTAFGTPVSGMRQGADWF